MSIDTAIQRFRSKQAEQFTTVATITRAVGEPMFDPGTEEYTQTYVTVYSGPCKIRPSAARSADQVEAGQTLVGRPDSEAKFPVDTDVERDDIVTVISDIYDQRMAGRSFTVAKAPHDAWQIARVAQLEETLPPLLNA